MKQASKQGIALVVAVWLGVGGGFAAAAEQFPADQPRPSRPAMQPAMDPMVRAILFGALASMLREAAESPDPMATLGQSLDRKLGLALRSPDFARLIESSVAQAVREAPAELREPLARFAIALLSDWRREMLKEDRPLQLP